MKKKTEKELSNLSKEDLKSYVLSFNSFIIECENFINKYILINNNNISKKFLDMSINKFKNKKQKAFNTNNKIKELVKKQNNSKILMEASSKIIEELRNENFTLNQRLKRSLSNYKSKGISNLNLENIYNKNDNLKKSLSKRFSKKNIFRINREIPIFSKDIDHTKDKYKLYKIKMK